MRLDRLVNVVIYVKKIGYYYLLIIKLVGQNSYFSLTGNALGIEYFGDQFTSFRDALPSKRFFS